jgi:hypothetical protein
VTQVTLTDLPADQDMYFQPGQFIEFVLTLGGRGTAHHPPETSGSIPGNNRNGVQGGSACLLAGRLALLTSVMQIERAAHR